MAAFQRFSKMASRDAVREFVMDLGPKFLSRDEAWGDALEHPANAVLVVAFGHVPRPGRRHGVGRVE